MANPALQHKTNDNDDDDDDDDDTTYTALIDSVLRHRDISVHCESKNCATLHWLITSTNVGRFSKFFHFCIPQEICNKVYATLPTIP